MREGRRDRAEDKAEMTGAVLAGGRSRRMGTNKALLRIDGATIIRRVVRTLTKAFDDVIIIANDPAPYSFPGVRIYPDIHIGTGSLGGLYTALVKSRSDHTFVTACDMPFLDIDCINRLLSIPMALMPCPFRRRQGPSDARPLFKEMHRGDRGYDKGENLRINSLLENIPVKMLTEADFIGLPISTSVENVNTEEDS